MKRVGLVFAAVSTAILMIAAGALAAVLNTSFDGDGIKTVNMAGAKADRFLSAAITPDGKVYVGGFLTRTSSGPAPCPTEDQVMAVARVNPSGSLDAGFSGDGIASVNTTVCGTTGEISRGLGIQNTGKVILGGTTEAVAGATPTDIAVTRLHTNGTRDTTFGGAGTGTFKLSLSTGAETMWGLTVQPDNKILLAANKLNGAEGRVDTDMVIVRLTADGALDSGFGGGDGMVQMDLPENQTPRQMVLDSAGNIFFIGYGNVTAGQMGTGSTAGVAVVLVKANSAGVLDPAFGDNVGAAGDADVIDGPGVARAQPISTTEGYDLGLQSDGKIVGCGYGSNVGGTSKLDAIAYRFTSTGQLDTGFGTGGITQLNLANEDDRCRDMVVLPDNKILLVGSIKPNADDLNGLIARLNSNGLRDNTFDGDGLKQVALGGTTDAFFGSAVVNVNDVYLAGFGGPTGGAGDSGKIVRYQGT